MIPTILTYSFRGYGPQCPDNIELGQVTHVPRKGDVIYISGAPDIGQANRPCGAYEVVDVSFDLDLGYPEGPRHWANVELEKVE